MSIHSIIDYIKNNNIEETSYFKGDINEYLNNGQIYINLIQVNFPDYYEYSNNSIVFFYNNYWIYLSYDITMNYKDIFWNISISKNKDDLKKFPVISLY